MDELLEDVFGFPCHGGGYGVVYGFEEFEDLGEFPAADLVYACAVDFHFPGRGVDARSLALGAGFVFEEAGIGVFLFFVGFVFAFLGHGVFEFPHEAFEVAVVRYGFLGSFHVEGFGIEEEVEFLGAVVFDFLVRVDDPEFDEFVPKEASHFVVDVEYSSFADGFLPIEE